MYIETSSLDIATGQAHVILWLLKSPSLSGCYRRGQCLSFQFLNSYFVANSVEIDKLGPLLFLVGHSLLNPLVLLHDLGLLQLGELLQQLHPSLSVLKLELVPLSTDLSLQPNVVLNLPQLGVNQISLLVHRSQLLRLLSSEHLASVLRHEHLILVGLSDHANCLFLVLLDGLNLFGILDLFSNYLHLLGHLPLRGDFFHFETD